MLSLEDHRNRSMTPSEGLRIAWARHTPLLAMELAAGCATRA
jgi:hypothetical protein